MVNELKKLILFIISIAFLAVFLILISIASYLGVLFVFIAIVIFVFFNKVTTVEKQLEEFVDLIAVLIWLDLMVLCIFVPPLNSSIIRVIVALPILILLPGYALIAALFPRRDDLDAIERVTLSFGLSIAVVPLVGLVLNYTPWGIQLEPVVISLVLLTVFLTVLGGVRRLHLPLSKRFTVPWKEITTNTWHTLTEGKRSLSERVLILVLLFSILVAVAAMIYVITIPKEGEHFTEFYLLGEKGKAADYPDQIIAGQNYPMFIGVMNHEYRTMNYKIEIWTLNREFDNIRNSTSILAMDPLFHQSFVLSDNETREIPYNLSIEKTGYNQVEVLLFNETVPGPDVTGSDRINMSYRDLHLWIDVS
jgi:uncharacterized membrane protein